MMSLKKKKEEKKEETSLASEEKSEGKMDVVTSSSSSSSSAPGKSGGLILFGVGGKDIKKDGAKKTKKTTPGEIRIQKDIAELDAGDVATVEFPNAKDLTAFNVFVSPDQGYWKGARYHFTFSIPADYPHTPPLVKCATKIYHPNIDLLGNVCLNVLREDWKPVLDINAVIYGVIYLFYEPNAADPLNKEAAELYRSDKPQFERTVRRSLAGQAIGGETFAKLI